MGVFGTVQLAGRVPKKLALNFEEFHFDVPTRKAEKAVDGGQHGVDRARRVAAVQQMSFPACGVLLADRAPAQPEGKGRQIAAVFGDGPRRALVRQKGQAVGVDVFLCDDVVHVDTSSMWYP